MLRQGIEPFYFTLFIFLAFLCSHWAVRSRSEDHPLPYSLNLIHRPGYQFNKRQTENHPPATLCYTALRAYQAMVPEYCSVLRYSICTCTLRRVYPRDLQVDGKISYTVPCDFSTRGP